MLKIVKGKFDRSGRSYTIGEEVVAILQATVLDKVMQILSIITSSQDPVLASQHSLEEMQTFTAVSVPPRSKLDL